MIDEFVEIDPTKASNSDNDELLEIGVRLQ